MSNNYQIHLDSEKTTFLISLDEIDLNFISTRQVRQESAPIWSLKPNVHTYYKFEVRADTEKSADNIGALSEPCKTTSEFGIHTCYICDVNVPAAYIAQHYSSNKHRICLKIANTASDRLRKQANQVPTILNLEIPEENTYLCGSCTAVIKIVDRHTHKESKEHKDAVGRDKLLSDLFNIYHNDEDQFEKRNINNNKVSTTDMELSDAIKSFPEETALMRTQQNKNSETEKVFLFTGNTCNTTVETQTDFEPNTTNLEPNEELLTMDQTQIVKQDIVYTDYLNFLFKDTETHKLGVFEDYIQITALNGDMVKVKDRYFNGFCKTDYIDIQCLLCQIIVKDKEAHKMEMKHINLVMIPIADKHCLRKVSSSIIHCAICNKVFSDVTIQYHSDYDPEHFRLLSKAKLNNDDQKSFIFCKICLVEVYTCAYYYHLINKKHFDRFRDKIYLDKCMEQHKMINPHLYRKIAKVHCNICNLLILEDNMNNHVNSLRHLYLKESFKQKILFTSVMNEDYGDVIPDLKNHKIVDENTCEESKLDIIQQIEEYSNTHMVHNSAIVKDKDILPNKDKEVNVIEESKVNTADKEDKQCQTVNVGSNEPNDHILHNISETEQIQDSLTTKSMELLDKIEKQLQHNINEISELYPDFFKQSNNEEIQYCEDQTCEMLVIDSYKDELEVQDFTVKVESIDEMKELNNYNTTDSKHTHEYNEEAEPFAIPNENKVYHDITKSMQNDCIIEQEKEQVVTEPIQEPIQNNENAAFKVAENNIHLEEMSIPFKIKDSTSCEKIEDFTTENLTQESEAEGTLEEEITTQKQNTVNILDVTVPEDGLKVNMQTQIQNLTESQVYEQDHHEDCASAIDDSESTEPNEEENEVSIKAHIDFTKSNKAISIEVVEGFIAVTALDGDRIKVSSDNFHGFIELYDGRLYCYLCSKYVSDKNEHVREVRHIEHLKNPIDDRHCIRKVIDSYNHCGICNQFVNDNALNNHINFYKKHAELMTAAIIPATGVNERYNKKQKHEFTFCKVCQMSIHTVNFEAHLNGKKHLMQLNAQVCDAGGEVQRLHGVFEETVKHYKLRCIICNVRVTNTDEELSKHVNGAKHNKMKRVYDTTVKQEQYVDDDYTYNESNIIYPLEYTGSPYDVLCKICQVEVPNSFENVEAHLKGFRHNLSIDQQKGKDGIERESEIKKPSNELYAWYQFNTSSDNDMVLCIVCSIHILNARSSIKDHLTSMKHKAKFTSILSENKIRYILNTRHYVCRVCEVRVRISNEFDHINLDEHKNNLFRCKFNNNNNADKDKNQNKPVDKKAVFYMCELCGVYVPNNETDIIKHNMGGKHKSYEMLVKVTFIFPDSWMDEGVNI